LCARASKLLCLRAGIERFFHTSKARWKNTRGGSRDSCQGVSFQQKNTCDHKNNPEYFKDTPSLFKDTKHHNFNKNIGICHITFKNKAIFT